jgi:hypothetical protein
MISTRSTRHILPWVRPDSTSKHRIFNAMSISTPFIIAGRGISGPQAALLDSILSSAIPMFSSPAGMDQLVLASMEFPALQCGILLVGGDPFADDWPT